MDEKTREQRIWERWSIHLQRLAHRRAEDATSANLDSVIAYEAALDDVEAFDDVVRLRGEDEAHLRELTGRIDPSHLVGEGEWKEYWFGRGAPEALFNSMDAEDAKALIVRCTARRWAEVHPKTHEKGETVGGHVRIRAEFFEEPATVRPVIRLGGGPKRIDWMKGY